MEHTKSQNQESSFQPEKLARLLLDHGHDWADKNAAADLLDETAKTVLAQQSLACLKDAGAANKAEMMARASAAYQDHINLMVEARRLANRAKVQYDADKAYVEMLRSKESTDREQMRIR